MNYRHFLLTRFNVPFIRKENIDFLFEEEYLQERFRRFKDCCFNSIKQQSNQNFVWLVFFDARTPRRYKDLNELWKREYSNYSPVYVDMQQLLQEKSLFYEEQALKMTSKIHVEDLTYSEYVQRVGLPSFISKVIKSFCGKDIDTIVTTRIDNDDVFHKDMMKSVIDNLHSEYGEKMILSFDNGVQYVDGSKILSKFYYPNNHFTSLVEKCSASLFSVFYWDHYFIDRYVMVKHINTIPLWMEICHKTNVMNSVDLTPNSKFIWDDVSLYDYGINKQWKAYETFFSLMLHPQFYFIPKFKKIIRNIIR